MSKKNKQNPSKKADFSRTKRKKHAVIQDEEDIQTGMNEYPEEVRDTQEVRDKVYASVFGKDGRGEVRGYGTLVSPTQLYGSCSLSQTSIQDQIQEAVQNAVQARKEFVSAIEQLRGICSQQAQMIQILASKLGMEPPSAYMLGTQPSMPLVGPQTSPHLQRPASFSSNSPELVTPRSGRQTSGVGAVRECVASPLTDSQVRMRKNKKGSSSQRQS